MTRVIDPAALKSGKLTDDEYRYLQDRGRLPSHLPFRKELVNNPKSSDLADIPNTGTVNTLGITQDDLEANDRRSDASVPTIKDRGGIQGDEDEEDDDESSYEDGWSNDRRREELSSRGLKVTGNKSALIGRLRRSDSDQLEDEDYEVE